MYLRFQTRYAKLCLSASSRNIPNKLLEEDYIEIVKDHKCHYCDSELSITGYQVDRKDNGGIYSINNCVPCCTTCNYKKGAKLTYKEMMILSKLGTLRPDLKNKMYNGIELEILDLKNPQRPRMSSSINLSFYQTEFDNKRDVCLSIIATKAGTITNKIGARKLEIRPVPTEENKIFLETNHIKGYSAAPGVGLYNGDELYMLLSYKKYPYGEVEIHRLATKIFHIIPGGFSKLLNHVIKETNPNRIFSFVDLRYHIGTGLVRLGFVADSKISKSWHWTDGKQLFNRLRCRANMDDRRLSQKEHAEEFGWSQVFDAGQQKFIKTIDTRIEKHSNYDTETWGQMEQRLNDHGFKVITTYEDYQLLERHKVIHISCTNKNHSFHRTRYRLWSLTDCPDCKGLRRRSSFKEVIAENEWEYISGDYEDKNSYLTCSCPLRHKLRRQYKWFRDNKCPKCAYENSEMLRRVSDALGGSPIERKRKVYEQILERCQQTNQKLETTWEDFLAGNKTSATIPIDITCKFDHTRNTIWQVAKEHRCGCKNCRSEKREVTKRKMAIVIENDIPFSDLEFKEGKRYSKLVVKEIIDTKNVVCECDCGEITVTQKYKLIRKKVKSCGCGQWDKVEKKVKIGPDKISGVTDKLKRLGYKRIEGSVQSEDSRLLVQCLVCENKREMNWYMIRGTCKNCYHKKQTRQAYQRVIEQANENNYTVLDSFEVYFHNCENKTTTRNCLVKINSNCPRGHLVVITSASASKRKWRCIPCIKENKSKD